MASLAAYAVLSRGNEKEAHIAEAIDMSYQVVGDDCTYEVYEGVYENVSNYRFEINMSIFECMNLCEDDWQCMAFEYWPDYGNRDCQLMSMHADPNHFEYDPYWTQFNPVIYDKIEWTCDD